VKRLEFKDMMLRQKIILIALVSTSIALLMAGLGLILNEQQSFPKIMAQNLTNLAQIVGDNCTAALSFNDNKTAQDVLSTLKANPHILAAFLYDGKGQLVASYTNGPVEAREGAPPAQREGIQFVRGEVRLFHYILSGKERLGTIYLESDMEEMRSRLARYILMMAVVWIFSILISLAVASRLQRQVTEPLRQVVDRMKDIAKGEGDLTKRLQVLGKDEIGEVAEAFNTYVDKLQSVDEMKLSLISVVSHQLKTPVAEINGYIENLMEGLAGELTPKQKQYLNDMREIGRENYRLICDLLSASKIERGVIAVDLKPVSIKQVAELSVRDYEESIRRKGLTLIREGFDKDFRIYADRDKTVETLRNVINNALKCTDAGSITIGVGNEGDKGLVEIRDTGIGMSEEYLGRLFTKSRVLGKEASRAGAGLGLYIAKNFMKLQGGDIRVTSRLGEGTCFTLVIPKFKEPEGLKA
jgi:signal transduction histidine kinase